MDAGRIAEFDTPLNLFRDPTSIFHQVRPVQSLRRGTDGSNRADWSFSRIDKMCLKSSITEDEIVRANADNA
jgi:hypothetical protein